jgi:hypothetical protein
MGKAMETFLQIVLSFPTVVYSVLLLVVSVHWLLSALGLLELDTIDGLLPGDGAHLGVDANGVADGAAHGGIGGLLLKFGLHGIPVMVIMTLIAIVGWSVCYFADLYLLRHLPGGPIGALAGAATAFGGLLLSIPVARIALAPVRRMLRRNAPVTQRPLLGRYAIVRSPEITTESGTAEIDDGGAGLILQVRADTPGRFVRGDRIVLIEYLNAQNAYRVTSAAEFEKL